MSAGTSIEWTRPPGYAGGTWNTINGCTPVSEGCRNCYAASFASRGLHPKFVGLTVRRRDALRDGEKAATRAVFNGVVRLDEESLTIPLRRRKPTCWFVNSMSDTFHEKVPFDFIDRMMAVAALCPQHRFLFLTKRPAWMAEYALGRRHVPHGPIWDAIVSMNTKLSKVRGGVNTDQLAGAGIVWPLPNVWLGTSVEDQETADARIPHLLRCPAVVRFLSVEPQLGPIRLQLRVDADGRDLTGLPGLWCESDRTIAWVIQGGESGPGFRPFNVEWARSIRDQCKDSWVPYFLKQLGRWPAVDELDPSKHHSHVCCMDGSAREVAFCGDGRELWALVDGESRWRPCSAEFAASLTAHRRLKDRKGGNPAEWPEDLRDCRAWPRKG